MIGPHEGKELELMLADKKPIAMFYDVVPEGEEISKNIIPEAAFAPYVETGRFKRFSKDIYNVKLKTDIRFVCFTLPGEEWRAKFLLWLKSELYSNALNHNPEHDRMIGMLLGYDDSDIEEYLK